jgi:hypothetical protein
MPRRRRKADKESPRRNRSSGFACLKVLGQIPVAKLGIPVDAKIEDQTAQHKEIHLPVSPLVELPEFWQFPRFRHSNLFFELCFQ